MEVEKWIRKGFRFLRDKDYRFKVLLDKGGYRNVCDEEVLKRALNADVTVLLNAGNDLDDNAVALNMARKYKNVWTSVGVHPDNALNKINKISVNDIIKHMLAQMPNE